MSIDFGYDWYFMLCSNFCKKQIFVIPKKGSLWTPDIILLLPADIWMKKKKNYQPYQNSRKINEHYFRLTKF